MFTLNIRKYRLLKRLTQEELGVKAGLSQGHISHLERENFARDKSPRLETIERIADILEVCPKSLINCNCRFCKEKRGE
jgi:transcriptional regulator with XRE-family HTH domain|nr:MAG TPA: helix-turn-helix domain protein [Caudoviricetes sp.]